MCMWWSSRRVVVGLEECRGVSDDVVINYQKVLVGFRCVYLKILNRNLYRQHESHQVEESVLRSGRQGSVEKCYGLVGIPKCHLYFCFEVKGRGLDGVWITLVLHGGWYKEKGICICRKDRGAIVVGATIGTKTVVFTVTSLTAVVAGAVDWRYNVVQ